MLYLEATERAEGFSGLPPLMPPDPSKPAGEFLDCYCGLGCNGGGECRMGNFEIIVFSGSFKEHTTFLAILKSKYPGALTLTDLNELNTALAGLGHNDVAAVFIDYRMLDRITPNLPYYNQANILWIVLAEESTAVGHVGPQVFDVLTCGAAINIQRFLKRLKKDVTCRLRLQALESEVREFYTIGRILSVEKDTKALLETVINACIDMTSSDGGTIYLVVNGHDNKWSTFHEGDAGNKLLKFVIARNRSINLAVEELTLPISRESLSGYAVITGRSVRIDDAYEIPAQVGCSFDSQFDRTTGYRTKSVLTVPMKNHQDRVLGVIQLINKKNREKVIPFEPRDEMVINSLAGQAAVALENNLLYRDMTELLEQYRIQNERLRELSEKILKAHEEERKRIARDIHDGPAQLMSSCSLKVEIFRKYLQRGMYGMLDKAMDELNESILAMVKDIRKVIYDLRPSPLEAGLFKALETHFAVFSRETGIKVKFSHTGEDGGLQYYLIATLYRVITEACTNIRKHAGATSVTVDLEIRPKQVYLLVVDDGKGFDPDSVRKKTAGDKLQSGFGLEGMRERVELVQGALHIDSSPGKGTRVEIVLPV
jgi:two-component system sensor histidine kinase DegS